MKKFYFFTFILLLAGNLFAQPTPVQPSGDGLTPSTAYHVDNLANLYWITQHSESWGSYFIQTADIDASSTSGWNSGAGFSPIGNGTTNFTGSYNGQSHTISGLYINRSLTDYIGLFGGTSTAASVKNIGLLNVAITGGAYYVGGVVGWSAGDLDHCYTTGSVNGIECVGGVVGYVNSGNITNCSSTATVSGSNFAVGGLVGRKGWW